ncbi:hypothetical protein SAMN05216251_103214 [Actinacidiphila alni]|uniref:Uncharacterized protein n=1 Tax=Actinacidiphila alni TaxID=380248 RepID=A0A1I2ATK4_9ACTN|nr:hypothetical protein [Actinacidiphila alni]SFE47057.1 hypothetical protein SAMN05216251_103214 [Actinacidiphila alni]
MSRGVFLAVVCGSAGLCGAGWGLAGPAGVLAAGICATVAAVTALRWSKVPPGPRTPSPSPGATPFENAEFARYRKVGGALSWSQVSLRHFDHALRPILERITAAVLLERAGVDTVAEPQAARDLLGPDLWKLADATRPRSDDSSAEPPHLDDVARLLRRLEDL